MYMKERKMLLRRQIMERRNGLTASERRDKESRINSKITAILLELSKHQQVTLLTFMPFRGEADITPVMEMGWTEGIRILVPKIIKDTHSLSLHEIRSYDDLTEGAFAIREPKSECPVYGDLNEITVILIPGVGFDRHFGRLGYGGGYYDRFVQLFAARGLSRPLLIAPAFDVQVVDQVPISWHDFLLDGLVTETLHLQRGVSRHER
jgi:5-formyltetrahydrofolate cyclo-ligase